MSCYKIYLASLLTVLIDSNFFAIQIHGITNLTLQLIPESLHILVQSSDILDNFVQYVFISKFITPSLGCELTLDI